MGHQHPYEALLVYVHPIILSNLVVMPNQQNKLVRL